MDSIEHAEAIRCLPKEWPALQHCSGNVALFKVCTLSHFNGWNEILSCQIQYYLKKHANYK